MTNDHKFRFLGSLFFWNCLISKKALRQFWEKYPDSQTALVRWYRLIASIHFNRGKVYVRHVLTHPEYDRGEWKK